MINDLLDGAGARPRSRDRSTASTRRQSFHLAAKSGVGNERNVETADEEKVREEMNQFDEDLFPGATQRRFRPILADVQVDRLKGEGNVSDDGDDRLEEEHHGQMIVHLVNDRMYGHDARRIDASTRHFANAANEQNRQDRDDETGQQRGENHLKVTVVMRVDSFPRSADVRRVDPIENQAMSDDDQPEDRTDDHQTQGQSRAVAPVAQI